MSTLNPYTYTVLRYVHDTSTGEFVNVGVALYCDRSRFTGALCRQSVGRISKVFPGVSAKHFKSLMRHVQARFEEEGEILAQGLAFEKAQSVLEIARRVVPNDDSALQWSPAGAGTTNDPAATLKQLFERMVTRYEQEQKKAKQSDEDIWRHFKLSLESRQIMQHLEPATVSSMDDEIEFKHTWRNGALHCLEPVSFDLGSTDSIKDKAHRWLGRVTSVSTSKQDFKVYFLVGQPSDSELTSAYESAVKILAKTPNSLIFTEPESGKLAEQISQQLAMHDS
jgi:hypothetical protein